MTKSTTNPNEKTFDKIILPININNQSKHIPKNATQFIDHNDTLKTLAIGVRNNIPILIIGESGTGKTSAIRWLAQETNNGLQRINLNGGTTADELVGRLLINEKGTYWVDGVLTEAMRTGDWIVLDEINAALPEVLFILQSVLDDDGQLVLNEKDDKEIVKKHPDFRLFATCNPPEYAGTKEMNKALLSRFGICINAEFPTEQIEKQIVRCHLGDTIANTDLTDKLISLAKETRESKEAGKTEYLINTRDILHTLKLAQDLKPQDAIMLAFANKLESADAKALQTMAKLHLPNTQKGAKAVKTQITSAEDLKIGNTYTIEKDIQEAYSSMTTTNLTTKELKELEALNLGEILDKEKTTGNATKGDEFIIIGTYYEEGSNGISKSEEKTLGLKAASMIEFTTGSTKKMRAIILHHKDLDNSLELINEIYAIN